MKQKTYALITLLLAFMLALTACGTAQQAATGAASAAPAASTETAAANDAFPLPVQDRAGNPITVSADIQKIVSMSPATTQLIESLGLLDKVIAVDKHSPGYVKGLEALPQFDMMQPDVEAMIALKPDIVFVTGMSSHDGGNPFKGLVDAGVCVAVIPSSSSIDGVREDIRFTAACLGKGAEGEKLVDQMNAEIEQIAAIGAAIKEKKTVMFEIAALPNMYSFGKGTFLNEMLEIIGAKNVFGDQEKWIPVTEEAAIGANPDVILTNVDYIEDPVQEILSRKGWEAMKAIQNKQVFYIDNGASNLTNQHISEALKQMAQAVYPEAYSAIQ